MTGALGAVGLFRRREVTHIEVIRPTNTPVPVERTAPPAAEVAPPIEPVTSDAGEAAAPLQSRPLTGQVQCRGFSVPKRGEEAASNQDAFDADVHALRFAVSDGVSQSAYPALWAQLLARGFVEYPTSPESLRQWLARPRADWDKSIDWEAVRGQLADWLDFEEVRREMAYATLLGLAFTPPDSTDEEGWRWTALAVGDSCLFLVRAGRLARAIPIEHPADFDRAVWALPSRASKDDLFVHWAEGEARLGDLFVLASDALSRWLLSESKAGGRPWERLLAVEDEAHFDRLVGELRGANTLENDDTTVLLVHLAVTD